MNSAAHIQGGKNGGHSHKQAAQVTGGAAKRFVAELESATARRGQAEALGGRTGGREKAGALVDEGRHVDDAVTFIQLEPVAGNSGLDGGLLFGEIGHFLSETQLLLLLPQHLAINRVAATGERRIAGTGRCQTLRAFFTFILALAVIGRATGAGTGLGFVAGLALCIRLGRRGFFGGGGCAGLGPDADGLVGCGGGIRLAGAIRVGGLGGFLGLGGVFESRRGLAGGAVQVIASVVAVELAGFFQLFATGAVARLRAVGVGDPFTAQIFTGEMRCAVGRRLGRWLVEDAAGRRIVGGALRAGALVNNLAVNGVQVLAGGVFQKAVAAFDCGCAVVEAAAFTDRGWRERRRHGRVQRAGVVLVDELSGFGGALIGFGFYAFAGGGVVFRARRALRSEPIDVCVC